jgi:hypothetical protein
MIIYSVVQTGERTTDRGTNSAPNIKRLCNGEYRPGQLYILSSRVAPDTTDADVHALCTKPAVLSDSRDTTEALTGMPGYPSYLIY